MTIKQKIKSFIDNGYTDMGKQWDDFYACYCEVLEIRQDGQCGWEKQAVFSLEEKRYKVSNRRKTSYFKYE